MKKTKTIIMYPKNNYLNLIEEKLESLNLKNMKIKQEQRDILKRHEKTVIGVKWLSEKLMKSIILPNMKNNLSQ